MAQWELRARGRTLAELRRLLEQDRQDLVKDLHAQTPQQLRGDSAQPKACKGNQHKCRPRVYLPALDRRFDLLLTGTGDSMIVGHRAGPRALVWKDTQLVGHHPDLGSLKVTLEPTQVHAGTLIPLRLGSEMPAVNRNTYFFCLEIESVGELISEEPAIVEALIDEIPPKATYQFLNPPLNFYLKSDPEKKVALVLEAASTDVEPAS